jgi:hypothetical protein
VSAPRRQPPLPWLCTLGGRRSGCDSQAACLPASEPLCPAPIDLSADPLRPPTLHPTTPTQRYGYYNPGGNQNLCTYCGDGYNTSAAANATAGEYKATDAAQCRVDFGYFAGNGGIDACLRGWYKDTLGPHACSQCPAGTSTTKARAGLRISDCDTCKPGFGVASGVIANLSAPSCEMCTSGTYSSGFKAGGQICDACPQSANFTGKMVSRPGVFTPEDCYGEYTTDKDVFDNQQAWVGVGVVSLPSGVWGGGGRIRAPLLNARHRSRTPRAPTHPPTLPPKDLIPGELSLQQGLNSVRACQEACSAPNSQCQYLAFYAVGGPGNGGEGVNECYFRVGSTAKKAVTASTTDSLVAFEIREGQYVVYEASPTEEIGVPLTTTGQSLFQAKAACEAHRACVGIAANTMVNGAPVSGWTLFGATLREGAIGKIRVVGENIQSWVPLPTGL